MMREGVSLAALTLALATPMRANAQDAMAKATAEALFSDGKRLMAAGNYDAACPKFAASQKLDPGVGTALNLADCYEKAGRIASAWWEFRSAMSAAYAAGSKDREQLAFDRASNLEKRLSYLTITTSPAQASTLRVSKDGAPVEPAVLGTPVPVDPGRHDIDAVAPGKPKWSIAIDVDSSPSRLTVKIPDLGDERQATAGAATTTPAPADAKDYGPTQRGVGIGVGAFGLIAGVTGTVFGLKAQSAWNDAKSRCARYPLGCNGEAIALSQDARAASNASTVAFVMAGAGLAGGALLFFTAPKKTSNEKRLSLRVSPSAVVLSAHF